MSARELANDRLFRPLGIAEIPDREMTSFRSEDVFGDNVSGWIKDPGGVTTGGWGLTMTPRDMARFGFLYLNRGSVGRPADRPGGVDRRVDGSQPQRLWLLLVAARIGAHFLVLGRGVRWQPDLLRFRDRTSWWRSPPRWSSSPAIRGCPSSSASSRRSLIEGRRNAVTDRYRTPSSAASISPMTAGSDSLDRALRSADRASSPPMRPSAQAACRRTSVSSGSPSARARAGT